MKTRIEIESLLNLKYKDIERLLNVKIRNGQTIEGIRKALEWVLKE